MCESARIKLRAGENVRALLWHCNIYMWHWGIETKDCFNCLASFSSPPRCSTQSSGQGTVYSSCMQTQITTNVVIITLNFSKHLCLTVVILKAALLTINSPSWSDYLQTVQQSQEKQSCCQRVGRGAQHCSLSWKNSYYSSIASWSCQAGGCRRATTCNRAQAMMLLTANPLSGCATKLTRMLPAAHTENDFYRLSRQEKEKKKGGYSQPGLLRGSSGAWTALPQRLAGWTEHQANSRGEGKLARLIM